ncbi:MAG: hypothetical protein WBE76_25905 [Terracidiphilus sp.]
MKMLRHNGEAVQGVAALVSISEDRFEQQLRIRGANKKGASLVGRARNCVSIDTGIH